MAYFITKKIVYVSGNHSNTTEEAKTPIEAKLGFHKAMAESMESTRTARCSVNVTDWQNHQIFSDSADIRPTDEEQAAMDAQAAAEQAAQGETE